MHLLVPEGWESKAVRALTAALRVLGELFIPIHDALIDDSGGWGYLVAVKIDRVENA